MREHCGVCGDSDHEANYSIVSYKKENGCSEEKKVYIWTCPNAPDYRIRGNWGYYELVVRL